MGGFQTRVTIRDAEQVQLRLTTEDTDGSISNPEPDHGNSLAGET